MNQLQHLNSLKNPSVPPIPPAGDEPEENPIEPLSAREFQVMQLIAMGRSTKEIAFELALSAKTVNTYRTRMMSKAKLKTTADIVRFAGQKKAPGPET